jgi:hypothetical protein
VEPALSVCTCVRLQLSAWVSVSSSPINSGVWAWVVLLFGAVLHAWGMADKHRLEAKAGAPTVWWSTLLYWVCWVLVGALVVNVVVRAVS